MLVKLLRLRNVGGMLAGLCRLNEMMMGSSFNLLRETFVIFCRRFVPTPSNGFEHLHVFHLSRQLCTDVPSSGYSHAGALFHQMLQIAASEPVVF
jgi:hypothetical protein